MSGAAKLLGLINNGQASNTHVRRGDVWGGGGGGFAHKQ